MKTKSPLKFTTDDVRTKTLEEQRRQKLLEHQRSYMREYRAGKRRRDKK